MSYSHHRRPYQHGHGYGYGHGHGHGHGGYGGGGSHSQQPQPSAASVAAAAAAAASAPAIDDEDASSVQQVVMEGLVVLKIAKHFHEEQMSGNRIVQGLLFGLVQDTRLEITNCFPFPRQSDDEEAANSGFGIVPVAEFDAAKYQLDIQKNFRQLNADYLTVGWYQSSAGAEFLTKEFVESQFHYQVGVLDAVALVYNPLKTSRGQLEFRAFRLSPALVKLMSDEDNVNQQRMKELMVNQANLVQELPVIIRNSHLANVLLAELEDSVASNAFSGLSLAMGSQLERQMKSLSTGCEVILQESSKYLNYQRSYKKYEKALQDQKMKIVYENQQRAQRGEEPLSEDAIDKSKLPKIGNPPVALDPVLVSAQLHQFTSELLETVGQSYGKLMLAEGIQFN
ncbi:hypothetical protein BOX15_Mlig021371g3 [Macrostomum lignano]|uniref:MPN domain-containing protein n=2 Tax=Macrostomum lignano TaxID=282301 RepID=A0A1I8GRS6_9PLAT|nr:hypothetical protein BOX15_Mlig021371g3 [Macrostomum lignano]